MTYLQDTCDQIEQLIQDTVEQNLCWTSLFESLRKALGFNLLFAFAFDKKSNTLSYKTHASMLPADVLQQLDTPSLVNRLCELMQPLALMSWADLSPKLNRPDSLLDTGISQLLEGSGLSRIASVKLYESELLTFYIAGFCADTDGGADIVQQERCLPLIAKLAAGVSQRESKFVYAHNPLFEYALANRSHQPLIVMTITGRVIQVNEAAEHLLQSTKLVAIRNHQLELPKQHMGDFWCAVTALEQQIRTHSKLENRLRNYRSIIIEDCANDEVVEHMYIFYLPLVPPGHQQGHGLCPLVLMMLYHPDASTTTDVGILKSLFGLSPAESKIAGMLAEGYSVIEISNLLDKKEDTIRKQLQSIYQKTSTKRQSELIKLLLHMPNNI